MVVWGSRQLSFHLLECGFTFILFGEAARWQAEGLSEGLLVVQLMTFEKSDGFLEWLEDVGGNIGFNHPVAGKNHQKSSTKNVKRHKARKQIANFTRKTCENLRFLSR